MPNKNLGIRGCTRGCQILVNDTTETKVLLRKIGPNMAAAPSDPQSFWEILESFGGEWIWGGIGCVNVLTREGAENTTRTDDMTWMVDGMKNSTITWCTDSSYHRKHTPKASETVWMAYCTKNKQHHDRKCV